MVEKLYTIFMETPIGKRYGQILVQKEQNRISGYLELMKNSEPFHGTIDENGNCIINGVIKTLMRKINYTASGQINQDSLYLSLQGEDHSFQVTGFACSSRKEQEYE